MSEETKSPIETVKEWWGIIVIVVGLIGGYIWLESTYARVEMLETERDQLNVDLKEQKAELNKEINELDCRLKYTIDVKRSSIEHRRYDELLALIRAEYNSLDPVSLTTPRATNLVEEIKSTGERLCLFESVKECQEDEHDKCFEGGKYDDKECPERKFYKECDRQRRDYR